MSFANEPQLNIVHPSCPQKGLTFTPLVQPAEKLRAEYYGLVVSIGPTQANRDLKMVLQACGLWNILQEIFALECSRERVNQQDVDTD